MIDIIILGSGSFAREAYEWCMQSYDLGTKEKYNVIGFFSGVVSHENSLRELPIYYDVAQIPRTARWVIGAGQPKAMQEMLKLVGKTIAPSDAVVHPSCVVGSNVKIGNGSIICPNTIITCDVQIGDCVIVNLSCTIGHDCVIGDMVHVSPNSSLSGNTQIGSRCEIGTGVSIVPGVTIIDDCVIGAGAVVTKHLDAAGVYTGVPATLKKR